MELYKKLLLVQQEMGKVKKEGYNSHSRYNYVTEADVLATVAPLLLKNSVLHIVTFSDATVETIERGGGFYNQATVTALLLLIDVETGGSLECRAVGYAHDKNGDKAVYKAQTGACKYAYLKAFGLGSGEDPEKDEEGHTPQQGSQVSKPDQALGEAKERLELKQSIGQAVKTHAISNEQFKEITGLTKEEANAANLSSLRAAHEKLSEWQAKVYTNKAEKEVK
jgi:methylphosphotriester-DNA--protein-cysteine methyltransferase